MNKTLGGRELYSDHPVDDQRWWFEIWKASGAPAFTIGDYPIDLHDRAHLQVVAGQCYNLIARLAAKRGWDAAGFEAAKDEAARIAPKAHRAEADARHLATL